MNRCGLMPNCCRTVISATLFAVAIVSTIPAFDGTVLYMNGNKLLLHNAATGADLVLSTQVDGGRGCFSPDGREVAMRHTNGFIRIFSVHGVAYRDLLTQPGSVTVSSGGYLTWTPGGYIYWIGDEGTGWDSWRGPHRKVYRVSASTGKVEIVFRAVDTMEQTSSITADGSTAYGAGHRWDLTGVKPKMWFLGGCGPAISSDGKIISQTPPYHRTVNFFWRDSLEKYPEGTPNSNKGVIDEVPLPPEVWEPRFATPAHAGNIWLVAKYGYGSIGEKGSFVFNRITKEYQQFPVALGNPCDYWPGPLPAAPASPVINLDKRALYRSSAGKDSVTVTNAGSGTLAAVSVTKTAGWITLGTPGIAGNQQRIIVTMSSTGIAKGVYADTVKVSAAGASGATFFIVNFAVGGALMAPGNLVASAGVDVIQLSWADRSSGETGFAVERKLGQGSWGAVGNAAANATGYADASVSATGTYSYRVRAVNGSDTSAWSDEGVVAFVSKKAIQIQLPAVGAILPAGSRQRITWTAESSISSVGIRISYDGGIDYVMLYGGSIKPSGDTLWGNFPFTVPATISDDVFIQIYDYANPGGAATSVGPLRIVAASSVSHKPALVGDRGIVVRRNKGGIIIESTGSDPLRSVMLFDVAGRRIHDVSITTGCSTIRINMKNADIHSGRYLIRVATVQGMVFTSSVGVGIMH